MLFQTIVFWDKVCLFIYDVFQKEVELIFFWFFSCWCVLLFCPPCCSDWLFSGCCWFVSIFTWTTSSPGMLQCWVCVAYQENSYRFQLMMICNKVLLPPLVKFLRQTVSYGHVVRPTWIYYSFILFLWL